MLHVISHASLRSCRDVVCRMRSRDQHTFRAVVGIGQAALEDALAGSGCLYIVIKGLYILRNIACHGSVEKADGNGSKEKGFG